MKKLLKLTMMLFIAATLILGVSKIDFHVSAETGRYIQVIKGTGKDFGDEVAIGNEHFYVIKYDGENLKLLAKYGVDVESTWLQSEQVVKDFHNGKINGVPYATKNKHNADHYTIYNGSNVEEAVNKYVTTLNKKYNINVTGKLVDIEDVITSVQYMLPDVLERSEKVMDEIENMISKSNITEADVKKVANQVLDYIYEITDKYNYLVNYSYWISLDKIVKALEEDSSIGVMPTVPYIGDRLAKIKEISGINNIDELFEFIEDLNNTPEEEQEAKRNEIQEKIIKPLIAMVIKPAEEKAIVRPLINVSLNDINFKEEKNCENGICFTDFNGDRKINPSDEICIEDECFYVLSVDKHTVKMLAKYNIETGYECDPNLVKGDDSEVLEACSIIKNATGKQTSKATGMSLINSLIGTDEKTYGVTEYSNRVNMGSLPSSYRGSLAKSYVDDYVEYLKSISKYEFSGSLLDIEDLTDIVGRDLINLDDIINIDSGYKSLNILSKNTLGIKFKKNAMNELKEQLGGYSSGSVDIPLVYHKELPNWVYSTTYWTKTNIDKETVAVITSAGAVLPGYYDLVQAAGIRPVITMELDAVPVKAESACYVCDNEMIWTNDPGSSCKINSSITSEGMCVNNPKTGIRKIVIISLIVVSFMVLGYVLYRRYNRFERV